MSLRIYKVYNRVYMYVLTYKFDIPYVEHASVSWVGFTYV